MNKVRKLQKRLDPQIADPLSVIRERSANLTNYLTPQICGIAILFEDLVADHPPLVLVFQVRYLYKLKMFQIVPYTDEVVVNSLDCFQVNGTSDMQVRIFLIMYRR